MHTYLVFVLLKYVLLFQLVGLTPLATSVRNLNLLEYQSKELLDKHGVTVQKFKMAESAEQAKEAVQTFSK